MSFSEIFNRVREWWEDADKEERYYAVAVTVSLLGVMGAIVGPSETRVRVRLDEP